MTRSNGRGQGGGGLSRPKEKEISRPSCWQQSPPLIEEESPSMVMVGVLGELGPREEVTESESRAEGTHGDLEFFLQRRYRGGTLSRGTSQTNL